MIDEKKLIEAMGDKNVEIILNLPVEEILGEDVDMDDFCMLLQDAIQSYRKMIIDVIKSQPKVGKWIPCSERLPEEKEWYQTTCSDNEIWCSKDIVRDLYWYPNLQEFVDNIRYERNGCKEIEKFFWTKYVTAWMPLPEPYKPPAPNWKESMMKHFTKVE